MTKIEYNGSVVANFEGGNTATLPVKDKKMKSGIIITVPKAENGKPIEIDSIDNSLLTAENDGKVYKCDDKLYQVEKINNGMAFKEYVIAEDKPIWNGTDLKGTTWLLNNNVEYFTLPGEFNLSGVAYCDSGHAFGINKLLALAEESAMWGIENENIGLCDSTSVNHYFGYNPNDSIWKLFYWTYEYDEYDREIAVRVSEEVQNISFAIYDGDCTGLPFVIDWFKQNGTLTSHKMPSA